MNFVVYCHLFLCIYIIYNVISMFLIVFGDFPNYPLYFGYNSTGQETPVCVFFCFRDLYGLKLTGDFSRIIIFQNMTIRTFGITQTESRRRKDQGGAPHLLGTPLVVFCSSEHPSRPPKAPEGSLDLKPHI